MRAAGSPVLSCALRWWQGDGFQSRLLDRVVSLHAVDVVIAAEVQGCSMVLMLRLPCWRVMGSRSTVSACDVMRAAVIPGKGSISY